MMILLVIVGILVLLFSFVAYIAMKSYIQINKNSTLNIEDQKAIACGANLSCQNFSYLNTLETGTNKAVLKKTVANNWGTNDKAEVFKITLDFIKNDNDSIELFYKIRLLIGDDFDKVKQQLELQGFDQENIIDLTNYFKRILETEDKMKLDGVMDNGNFLKSAKGYNLSRTINMARWYFDLGIIDKEEAMGLIRKAYQSLVISYDNWKEISIDYIGGRVLWFHTFGDYYDNQKRIQKELLEKPNSPWVNIKLKA